MKVLNSSTLQDAFIRCSKYSHYKVDIILQTSKDVMNFADEIKSLFETNSLPGVYRITSAKYHIFRITFKNESTIEVVPATDMHMRGIRYHELLYDDSVIMSEEVHDILISRMVPFKSEAYKIIDVEPMDEKSRLIDTFCRSLFGETPCESEELDSFLSSFVINS